jgi:hypothetical protein
VSPGFFDLFTIPRRQGRDFVWSDDANAQPVAIVNETLARALFPDGNAVDQTIRLSSAVMDPALLVIGLAADSPVGSIQRPHVPVIFRPIAQQLSHAQFPLAHVRVRGDARGIPNAFSQTVQSQGRHFVAGVFRFDQWIDFALLQQRMLAALSGFAAWMTLLLACIGVYSLLSYAVTSRIREIGIRMALGASGPMILSLVVKDAAVISVIGLGAGMSAAVALTSVIQSQLYGIGHRDPVIMMLAPAVLLVVILSASLIPAIRAAKLDAITALRVE